MSTIGIIGAGTMGWSIAQVFSAAGYRVMLCDQEKAGAEKGKAAMAKSLARVVAKGKMDEARRDEILGSVQVGTLWDVAGCALVLEAITENMAAKQKLFAQLEKVVGEDAIFATNTSTLSITEMAAALKNPSRLAGMHFFNPAVVMKLVEVVGGGHTAPDVLNEVMRIAADIGKIPVRVEESAGFVVNRILIPMINEAVFVLEEGVASAGDIDTAMKLGANHPMGPLALGDLIGLDVVLASMEVLLRETGDQKYRPHTRLRKMVRSGQLGRKTGQGFFTYE